jgi:hypothetical protein
LIKFIIQSKEKEMKSAKILTAGENTFVESPYNAEMIAEIKEIPGRQWKKDVKAWMVPSEREQELREIVRKYFVIEGEESEIEYEVLNMVVEADNTRQRSAPHGLTVDGCDIVYMNTGHLCMKASSFEILEAKGGYRYGDSRRAYGVRYEIKIKVRKGAKIEAYGRCGKGSFEIIPQQQQVETPSESATDTPAPTTTRRGGRGKGKELSPELQKLQLPEGKKAALINGKIVVVEVGTRKRISARQAGENFAKKQVTCDITEVMNAAKTEAAIRNYTSPFRFRSFMKGVRETAERVAV